MHGMLIALALVFGTIATAEGASPHAIQPSDICAGATLIDFETATTALPVVPGVTFVDSGSHEWLGGNDGPFGVDNLVFGQVVRATYERGERPGR